MEPQPVRGVLFFFFLETIFAGIFSFNKAICRFVMDLQQICY